MKLPEFEALKQRWREMGYSESVINDSPMTDWQGGKWSMELPEFLTEHPYGAIRITGRRIGLEHVLRLYREGRSVDEIHEEYDIESSLIQKVVDYYLDHQTGVDAYVKACEEEADRLEKAHVRQGPTMEELRRRMIARGLRLPSTG